MAKAQDVSIEVFAIETETIEFYIVGDSPLILNTLSNKAKHELLLPKGRKTATDKAKSLKHHPYDEFRSSPHYLRDSEAPTRLALPSTAFKGALRSAAIDAGAKKSEIGRLTYVPGEYVPIYGVPRLLMTPVRLSDMSRTPDIRTRCILPEWCACVQVVYTKPKLRREPVVNLFAASGQFIGVGDWRPEKGSGAYGRYRIVAEDDPEWERIAAAGGRAAQAAGMDEATPYDEDSADLLAWWEETAKERGYDTGRGE